MKIIRVNNYDEPIVSDDLIVENVNRFYGEVIVELLNCYARAMDEWFKLVEDGYKLYDADKELYGNY